MVLSRLSVWGLGLVCLLSCQPLPDYEKHADVFQSSQAIQKWAGLQDWIWTCRAEWQGRRAESESFALNHEIEKLSSFFRERGFHLVDVEPAKIDLGSAWLWNPEGVLLLSAESWESLGNFECRHQGGVWRTADLWALDESLKLGLLKVSELAQEDRAMKSPWRRGQWRGETTLQLLAAPLPEVLEQRAVSPQLVTGHMRTGMDEDLIFFQPAPGPLFRGALLVNAEAEVLGWNFPTGSSVWGTALKTESLQRLVEALLKDREVRRWYWGFRVRYESKRGFVVQAVDQASPAREAGLRVQDVIVSWNAQALRMLTDWPLSSGNSESFEAPVELGIEREGNEIKLAIQARLLRD